MTPWVRRLIIANVVMFFVDMVRPGFTSYLVLHPNLVWVRPWTLVTYMFLHSGLVHILFNMFALSSLGSMVEQKMGERRFIELYFASGIAGGLLSILLAPKASIVGASGGLFGVMLAFAQFWPDMQLMFFGVIPMTARTMVLVYTVFSLWSGFMGSRMGLADFAHLGGFVGAWAYLRWLAKYTGTAGFRAKTVPKVANTALRNYKNVDTSKMHPLNKEELDRILDKVSATGLTSLTPQEKAFLVNFVPPDDRPVS